GVVTYAGTVAANGKALTSETPDGWSVTLTHLGSITVKKGATVAEGDGVGTIGPTGEPEVSEPYVHLGVRTTAGAQSYVDPLGLLPMPAPSPSPAAAVVQPLAGPAPPSGPAVPSAASPGVTPPAPATPPTLPASSEPATSPTLPASPATT